jgi:hypothetical protein
MSKSNALSVRFKFSTTGVHVDSHLDLPGLWKDFVRAARKAGAAIPDDATVSAWDFLDCLERTLAANLNHVRSLKAGAETVAEEDEDYGHVTHAAPGGLQ